MDGFISSYFNFNSIFNSMSTDDSEIPSEEHGESTMLKPCKISYVQYLIYIICISYYNILKRKLINTVVVCGDS